MIAYCGLTCAGCPAYQATRDDDDQQRAQVAATWSKLYNADITPESINCDGCKATTGRLFSHCDVCQVRACAVDKGMDTCAACDDYSCQALENILQFAPEARTKLEELRAGK